MADLKKELTEAERELRRYLKPRLIIGLLVLLAAAVYIFWPH
jgi:hypothetical protein